MKARERWKQIQATLGTTQDGIPGPNDEAALDRLKTAARMNVELPINGEDGSDIGFPVSASGAAIYGRGITVHIDGEDLLLKNVRVTCFGGTDDPQDSGDTASGVSTKNPATLGCALPRNYTGPHGPTRRALQGSPIPEKLPWKTPVAFTDLKTGKTLTVPLIDLGPNLETTTNAGDLTVAAAKQFNPHATARNFEMMADIRIIGGAKYL